MILQMLDTCEYGGVSLATILYNIQSPIHTTKNIKSVVVKLNKMPSHHLFIENQI